LHAAGLSPPASPSNRTQALPTTNAKASSSKTRTKASLPTESFECPICCLDFEPENVAKETYSLGCDHRFCKGCWTEYLERKILDEQESGRVQCMEDGCGRVVGEKAVLTLVEGKARERCVVCVSFTSPSCADDSTALCRYRVLLDRTYVDDSPQLRWCPHPECEYAVYCKDAPARKLDQIVPIVHCACGNDFCFGSVKLRGVSRWVRG